MSHHPPPHPATANSRYLAFFDECGDHSLTRIDADFPLKANEPQAIASQKIYENGGLRGWKVFL